MDAATALDSLSTLLTSLSETPYLLALHAQHIQLASQPTPELPGQLDYALELLLSFYSATDQVWLPFLHQKVKSLGVPDDLEAEDDPTLVDLQTTTVEAVSDVLKWFKKAEDGYLSIPVLQKKIELLTLLHASFVASPSSSEFGPLLAEEAVRSAIADAASKGSTHMTKGHILWGLQVAWELSCLEATKPDSTAREALKDHTKALHIERLGQIHSTHEQTLQSYSSFVSQYYHASEYESHLVLASQTRAGPMTAWDKKERYELALENSLESYQSYIWSEQKVKSQNGAILNTLYERVIAQYASRRWDAYSNNSDAQTIETLENTLRTVWCDYIDTIRESGAEVQELPVFQNAVRSVPGSGEVWARYIRALERSEDEKHFDAEPTVIIADVYAKALSTSLVQQRVDQIVPLVLARAGYENRHLTDEGYQILIKTLEDGISMVRQAAPEGDPRMTLEKYLVGFYMNEEDPSTEQALALWQSTAKYYKTSYLAWSKYSELLIAQNDHLRARALFKDVSTKEIDWPEAIWQAWTEFEHLHGSVETVESCLKKIKVLNSKLERKRAQEAEKAAAAQQAWIAATMAVAAPQEAPASAPEPAADAMVIDTPDTVTQPDKKRKADEPGGPDASKRAKLDEKTNLKRDRENSTVFISGLPVGTIEDDLVVLFKDCGKIREVRLSQLPQSLGATVEFSDRTSVPAALTKDKKRLKGEEIAVHLAWESTLYVTNFPEKTDDTSIRELFGPHGEILDVRWPSKKYKSTRRFCYIQYTSPSAAKSALELHGRELEPGRNLTVYVSNPGRKQERTDAAANAREIYVAGLSKSVTEGDLRKLFEKFGTISGIRLILDEKGTPRGFAFVEFQDETFANAALAANNQELKKRRIAVTLADTRVQPRQREGTSSGNQARRSRTLRVKNLPPGTEEGLLQQALEKHADVKRVEIFKDKNEAIAELASVAEAGKLLLMQEPITFGDRALELIEEDLPASAREPTKTGLMFVPRGAAGRPRAGIGSKKSSVARRGGSGAVAGPSRAAEGSAGKGQDDFRRMLNPSK